MNFRINKKNKNTFLSILIIVCFLPLVKLDAKIVLPSIFSNGMVLQQKSNVAVWGESDAGQVVQINTSWNKKTYTIAANQNGKWKTRVTTPSAGGPYILTVKDSSGKLISIKNILIGEVFICAGQSNMVTTVKVSNNAENEAKDANYSQIRVFKVPHATSLTPVKDIEATWESPNSQNVMGFGAIAFFFARDMYKHFKVPIGIIHSAFGSSTQESWLSEDNIAGIAYDEKILSDARNGLLSKKFLMQKVPTTLYNTMVRPFVPFTVKGVCWYQGTANVDHPYEYEGFLNKMVTSWRKEFEQPDLPFFIIQMTGSMDRKASEHALEYVRLQESQFKISQKLPAVSTIMSYDIGDPNSLHFKNKQDAALRLSFAVRKVAYGEDIIAQGPVMESIQIKGTKVHVNYKNTGKGLTIKNGSDKINNFLIAGEDKNFYPAEAKLIDNKSIEISSENVEIPKYIRYAFACFNPDVNLYNSEGLPAVPFRTDDILIKDEKLTSKAIFASFKIDKNIVKENKKKNIVKENKKKNRKAIRSGNEEN